MEPALKVLVIDDSEDDVEMILRHLGNSELEIEARSVWRIEGVREALAAEVWDLVLCDHFLPGFSSNDVLDLLRESNLGNTPFILVSGEVDTSSAVATMLAGANDFIFKDDLARLVPAIRREIAEAGLRREKVRAERELKEANVELTRTLKELASTRDRLVAIERFKALGQMSSGIAHDFNNSLTKMAGVVEQLELVLPEEVKPVSQLRTMIGDAATVVRRLCDYYRKPPEDELSAVDVHGVLCDVREFTRSSWQNLAGSMAEPISVAVVGGAQSPVLANASKLREVLTNLIFNSYSALEFGGGKIELIARDCGNGVEVDVRDNGCGMSSEVLARCMEPLYSTKGSGGTGLGLSIVEDIVRSFGGSLRIKSVPGTGTTVTICLKRAAALEVVRRRPVQRCETSPLNILLVDDEPIVLQLQAQYLAKLGHRTQCVGNPLEAFPLLASELFDLVISDRSMPEMSGDDFALRLRRKLPEIRFIMVSGYGDLMRANNETPEGVDLVLAKPFTEEMLAESLQTLFGNGLKLEEVSLPR